TLSRPGLRGGPFTHLESTQLSGRTPGNFINSRDDRAGDCFYKGFSEGVAYPRLRATEENLLWKQETSEGACNL
ncbi:hypothetical protein, partial [Thiolapillus sp.]